MHRSLVSVFLLGLGVTYLAGCSGSDKETGDTGDTGHNLDSGDTGDTGDTADTGDTDTGVDAHDADGDGYVDSAYGGDDCNDADINVNPGMAEIPDDGIDQDCDGEDAHTPVPADDVLPGELVITEIMKDPDAAGDSQGEWFEVLNTGAEARDLDGLVVYDDTGATFTVAGPLPIAPGEYLVLGLNADVGTNGGVTVDYAYTNFVFSNGDDAVVLANASGDLDRVAYDPKTGWPDPTGRSMSLSPDATSAAANDDAASWCEATSTYGAGDRGTPGAANDICVAIVDADGDGYTSDVDCNDGDATIHPGALDTAGDGIDQDCDGADGTPATGADAIAPGELVITEIMKDPALSSDSYGEYVELYNASGHDIDLEGLVLRDDGSNSHTVTGSLVVRAGAYVLLGESSDSSRNGGIAPDYIYTSFQLTNSGDQVVLENSYGELDRVNYDGGTSWPSDSGVALSLDPGHLDPLDNDDPANWCNATSTFGLGDHGTPGAANDTCGSSTVDADGDGYTSDVDCNDADATIYPGAPDVSGDGIDSDCDGSDASGAVPADSIGVGELVISEIMKDPAAVSDSYGEYVELYNASGRTLDLDGLVIYDTGVAVHTVTGTLSVAPGDYVLLGEDTDSARNGGLTLDYLYTGLTLNNSGNGVGIGNTSGVIDEVTYTTSGWPNTTGASLTLDPTRLNAASNDDGGSWCDATSTYGSGDLGTPGAANDSCGLTTTDADADGYSSDVDCNDADATIHPGATDIPDDGIDQDCSGSDATTAGYGVDDLLPGELVVNEVMKNPAAVTDSYGEWFEVYNASGVDVDLLGLEVSDASGAGFTVTTSLVVAAGGYVLFGENADSARNGGITPDYVYSGLTLANDATDQIWLANAAGYLDQVQWTDADFPDTTGAALSLDPDLQDSVSNDVGTSWCDAQSVYGAGDLGTPGEANDDCPAPPVDADADGYDTTLDCNDADPGINPGATDIPDDGIDQDCDGVDATSSGYPGVDTLVAGDLVINEILNNPAAVTDSYGEWFEVVNVSGGPVDLDGLVVSDDSGASFTVSGSLPIEAGAYLVFGKNADTATNGGVSVDYAYRSFDLGNGADAIVLSNAAGEIDRVNWDTSGTWPVPNGASLSLDPAAQDATLNDDGANWCEGATVFGTGDLGTPGAANEGCGVSFADADADGYDTRTDCNDADAGINPGATDIPGDGIDQDCSGSDATVVLAVADLLDGDLVVTEIMNDPNAVSDTYGEWFEVYNAAGENVELSGLVVTDGTSSFTVTGSLVAAPGEYVVFGLNGNTAVNGGVSVDYDYPVWSMVNTTDTVALTTGTLTVDTVTYDNGATFPKRVGVAMSLDPSLTDAALNDDGTSWCEARTPYGSGDLGTPGTVNESCASAPPDADADGFAADVDCNDADATIHPGAYDTPGDGIDQDCDGVDASAAALTIDDLTVGELVITEILQDPAAVSDSYGEWFEVYNGAGASVDLNGLVATDGTNTFTVTSSLVVAAGAYVVFGESADTTLNGNVRVDYAYSGFPLANGADSIELQNGTGTLDSVAWDGGATFPDPTGASMILDPSRTDATQNDSGANWCTSTSPFGLGDLGTPGNPNDGCPGTAVDGDGDLYTTDVDCDDTNATIHPGAYDIPGDGIDQDCDGVDATVSTLTVDDLLDGDLVITEVLQDPAAVTDSYGEWFEVYNASGATVDLAGLVVTDGTSTFTVTGSFVVSPAQYVVFGENADPALNGGVTVAYDYASFTLSNSSDAILLQNSTLTLDSVAWDNGATFPDPTGASMSLDPTLTDATLNDDGANWCTATSPFGLGDLGTPGAPNDPCATAAVDADGDGFTVGIDCNDADATIHPGAIDIPGDGIDQDCDGVDATAALTVADLVAGDLVVSEILADPSAVTDSYGEWFEVYNASGATVDLSGLVVYDLAADGVTVSSTFTVTGSLVAAPGDRLVFGENADTALNGGVALDYLYPSFNLSNAGDEIVLGYGATVIDSVVWTSAVSAGRSKSLMEAHLNSTDNDATWTNWCNASATFGAGDRGTPGATNDC